MEIKQERISFDGGGTWHTLIDIDEPPALEAASFVLEAIWLAVLMLVAVAFAYKLHHIEWSPVACGLLLIVAIIYFLTKHSRLRRATRAAKEAYQQYKASLTWRTEQITIRSSIPRLLNTSRGLVQLSESVYQSYLQAGSPEYAVYSLLAPQSTERSR